MTVYAMFVGVAMVAMMGLAVDVMQSEYHRTRLQSVCDSAVLAAADMDQRMDPAEVVQSYFEAADMEEFIVGDVFVETELNGKTVGVKARGDVSNIFLPAVGMDTFPTGANCIANETIPEVEISLVLDVSGSMNNNNRLTLLKAAARDFVTTTIDESDPTVPVSISIIPFATQVNAGPRILEYFDSINQPHNRSHCLNFESSDFTQVPIDLTQPIDQTAHFELRTWNRPMSDWYAVCSPDNGRRIMPWETSVSDLHSAINAFAAGGNTSIEIGTKWGAALLDPSLRGVANGHIGDGYVSASLAGRPYNFTEDGVVKVLVVMSDGQNTDQWYLKDEYRSGPSGIWVDENGSGSADDEYTTYRNRSGTDEDWYHHDDNSWEDEVDGAGQTPPPYEMGWQEVFQRMSVAHWSRYIRKETEGGDNLTGYYDAWDAVPPGTKNTRTSQICAAARAAGINVFTISFEAPTAGQQTLRDCANDDSRYYDVDGLEISEAFGSIALQINQLRLTQ